MAFELLLVTVNNEVDLQLDDLDRITKAVGAMAMDDQTSIRKQGATSIIPDVQMPLIVVLMLFCHM